MTGGAQGAPAGHGTLAEETALLFEALQQAASLWTASQGANEPSSADAGIKAPAHGADPSVCQACPVCRLLSAMRQVNPQVIDHLAAAAASLAAAARDLVAPVGEPGPEAARRREEPRVQHIDISD